MKCLLLAAALVFRLLDVNSGLPENNVRNMTMLPDGMMCIQTSSALSLYDGERIRSFRYDPEQVPYSEYSGMTEAWYDPSGKRVWCKAKDKLWIFALQEGEFDYSSADAIGRMGIEAQKVAGFNIDSTSTLWLVDGEGILWRKSLFEEGPAVSLTIPCHGKDFLMERSGDILWILSSEGSLMKFSIKGNGISGILDLSDRINVGGSSHLEMKGTPEGRLWILSDKLISLFDPSTDNVVNVLNMPEGSSDLFTSMACDRDGNLWVGSARSGITIVDGRTLAARNLPSLKLTDGEEIHHHTDISKIYSDRRGGIWVATLTEGLMCHYPQTTRFENINHTTVGGCTFADEGVKCLLENENGSVLVGTIKGLLEYNPETRKLSIPYPELSEELVISLYRDRRGRIWAGTFYNGAYCIDGTLVRHFSYRDQGSVDVSYQEHKPNNNCVRCFFEDSSGKFWISTYGGLGIMDTSGGKITALRDRHPEISRFMIIRSVCEPVPGILLACGDNGSFRYDVQRDSILMTETRISSNAALLDSRGLLWTSDRTGIAVTDAAGMQKYDTAGMEDLGEGAVMSIVQDDYDDIWVAGSGNIFRIHLNGTAPEFTADVVKYGKEDGLDVGALFQNSVLRHSDGHICFGGVRGISAILPSGRDSGIEVNGPVLLSYTADGARHVINDDRLIRIRHNEVPLELSFSNFDLANPDHVLYSYKLDGFDKSWQNVKSGEVPSARYTLIRPGDYVFRVRSRSLGTEWQETAVRLKVSPPFAASVPAMFLYLTVFLLAVFGIVLYYRRKEHRKMQYQMEKERIKRQEELDQMKFRFFTNISHELRTPLSLILLPLQSLMKENGDIRLETISKNANELLDLVNHLLDFRKLEMGGEKLSLSRGNIAEFVCMVAEKFKDVCARKNIYFEVEDYSDNPLLAFDSSKIKKIVHNLLSNAVKFTPEGGSISLKNAHRDGYYILEVSDSGVGIDAADKERLFERFYRSNENDGSTGTGIGLNLVKQYTDMMSGRIEVESEPGKGSTFRIYIPDNLEENAPPMMSQLPETERTDAAEPENKAMPGARSRVLIVDDNASFREYITGELSSVFDVRSAENGLQALEKVKEGLPDIIVCDVMMPGMDGMEFTSKIKGDIETSHIPVILLTARLSEETRLEGYETGADAYLTKPFQMDMLVARINNLLDEGRQRRLKFATNAEYSPKEITITTIDQQLMQRIMDSVERNIANQDYSVEMLASDVSMHRMNLYRKLQAITGTTPLEFIRTMRLKRAAQLLTADSALNVNEVAEMVGFSTTKYFSKYFKEMFGVYPSQWSTRH